jgi:hypothetical protein
MLSDTYISTPDTHNTSFLIYDSANLFGIAGWLDKPTFGVVIIHFTELAMLFRQQALLGVKLHALQSLELAQAETCAVSLPRCATTNTSPWFLSGSAAELPLAFPSFPSHGLVIVALIDSQFDLLCTSTAFWAKA